jgi:hypothetical protein
MFYYADLWYVEGIVKCVDPVTLTANMCKLYRH